MGRVTHYDTVQMMTWLLANRENVAKYYVTVTAGQTHTIQSLRVSAATTVNWGDGLKDTYTGIALRTHTYANAGTYEVDIYTPENVMTFDLRDGEAVSVINSADLKTMVNVSTFQLINLPNATGTLDSADMVDWLPNTFYLYNLPNATITLDSADLVDWRPSTFTLYNLQSATVTLNSADMVDWRPIYFYLNNLPNATGTLNSADMVDWRPSTFQLHTLPNATGTLNSTDMVDWRPSAFNITYLPNATGTINSADMVDWRPSAFTLYNLTNATGTINSADLVDWRPSIFTLYNITSATITIAPSSIKNWATLSELHLRTGNLTQPQADLALWECYQIVRTATGGIINMTIAGNAAPSGTFQPCQSPPVSATTPGKEIAYELLNDSLGVGFNKWTTVRTN
jgi:hypothetical protein